MKTHTEIKEISCPFCDQVFPQRHLLHQHLVMDHEESSNLICPVCQKVIIFSRHELEKVDENT